jgi:hypothetical protein
MRRLAIKPQEEARSVWPGYFIGMGILLEIELSNMTQVVRLERHNQEVFKVQT